MLSIRVILSFVSIILVFDSGLSKSLRRSRRDNHGHWGYGENNGPEKWGGICEEGKRQSPIDIDPSNVILTKLPQFEFSQTYVRKWAFHANNNGHSIAVTRDPNVTNDIYIDGGGLGGKYIFKQLHFHWGSEHTINGERKPLEVHLVHYNAKYGSLGDAVNKKNGLAVIGILFDTNEEENNEISEFLTAVVNSALNAETGSHSKRDIPPEPKETHHSEDNSGLIEFSLLDLFPDDIEPYYRYEGSLTTPGCDETVTWTVLKNQLPVSPQTLELFKKLPGSDGDELQINFRPTQELNDRKVYLNTGHPYLDFEDNDIDDNALQDESGGSAQLTLPKYLLALCIYFTYYSLSSQRV